MSAPPAAWVPWSTKRSVLVRGRDHSALHLIGGVPDAPGFDALGAEGHAFLNRLALTCSQEMTSEGSCSCLAVR